ncbi:MAG: TPM domain-containing protein [Treponema sp.]
MKKLNLDKKSFVEIQDAVKNAESKTTGEIEVAVTAESAGYAFWELLFSVGVSLVLLACLFPLANQIYSWLCSVFWGHQPWYLPAFYLIVCAAVVLVLYILFNIPAVDSLIVPQTAKVQAVNSRAMRYFAESGVYCTKEHTGILIFVSYFEKEVRIIADKGISEKITQDLWNLIADELADSLSKGNAKDAFINAINRCGDLLAEYYPAPNDKENVDELPDGLVVLENDRWV